MRDRGDRGHRHREEGTDDPEERAACRDREQDDARVELHGAALQPRLEDIALDLLDDDDHGENGERRHRPLGDERDEHRERAQIVLGAHVADERRHDRSTVEGRVFSDLAHLGEVRAGLPQLSADVRTVVAPVDDEGVLVTYRDHPRGSFVGVYNVTPDWRSVPAGACTLPPT